MGHVSFPFSGQMTQGSRNSSDGGLVIGCIIRINAGRLSPSIPATTDA
jgi:hypothetical protein